MWRGPRRALFMSGDDLCPSPTALLPLAHIARVGAGATAQPAQSSHYDAIATLKPAGGDPDLPST